MSKFCFNCVNYKKCNVFPNAEVSGCDLYEEPKICPIGRRDNGKCSRDKCAWWDDGIGNCVVHRIGNNDESLEKEVSTVFGIVAGGED